ncbi:MAG: hypothetical protein A3A30_00400 [Candidatus Terrybacteria bacterium RIFCSPLOWO2_01_FULL_48_14]|nr:MAG: hypothetical protein A3A30_00400 [Candidatus Terrybacteria bacterium RIFCSPLOWO2_01_FULL_48_14]
MHKDSLRFKKNGQSVVEIILAVAVFSIIASGVVVLGVGTLQGYLRTQDESRAIEIVQEGMDAVRSIRDRNWSSLSVGSHGLSDTGGLWVFSGVSEIVGKYTRTVTVNSVSRNTLCGDPGSGTTQDPDSRGIDVSVIWHGLDGNQRTISTNGELTRWPSPKFATCGGRGWRNPFQEVSIDISGTQDGRAIRIQGDYAYMVLSGGAPNFFVIDTANTQNPSIVGSLNLSGNPRSIWVSGDYAYVASSHNNQELQIVDITVPSSPTQVGSFDATGATDALGVFSVGTSAYLVRASSNQNEFFVINVSIPSAPSLVGSLDLGANANDVTVVGTYAFIASSHNSQELQVVSISAPTTPTLAGSLNLAGNADGLAIAYFSNKIVLGRASGGGLVAIDVTFPTSPGLLGLLANTANIDGVSLDAANSLAFLATDAGTSEFQVIDISNPASPQLFGSLDANARLFGVAYHSGKDRAFAAGISDTEEFIVAAPEP